MLAPFNAWLTLRGCRSLPARMALHCSNARRIARFLEVQPQVERVNYPGLASHPGHALAAKQMRDFGGMLSVQLRGRRDAALAVASKLQLFTNATSLGGASRSSTSRCGGRPAHDHAEDLMRCRATDSDL